MTGISPNYSDWRKLSSIAIWEIACLMQGFDPRAVMAGEVIVRDPSDPTGSTGMEPDTAWEERMLISAVCTQDLLSAPGNCTAPGG